MKKRLLPLLLALALLAGCAGPTGDSSSPKDDNTLTVVTTTYPLYLLASALTRGVDGAAVLRLDTGSASCLHDYTLSVNDMKKLAQADVIALNGAELEEFMDDALDSSSALPIDCSRNVTLLPALDSHDVEEDHDHDHDDHDHDHDHDDHDHDHGDTDPHIWMDPQRYAQMAEALAAGLTQADPDHAGAYEAALNDVTARLRDWDADLRALFDEARQKGLDLSGLITFHDGFQYFAAAYGLPLLASIEEEAGSEASAKEIMEITEEVHHHHIPVIFTEVNGSDATAQAIARETGCAVAQLTMLMDGPDDGLENYYHGLRQNAAAIINGFAGEEWVK